MPKARYSLSELVNMNSLERIFWLEIAKRKQRLKDESIYMNILTLRREMEIFFEQEAAQSNFDLEYGVDFIFDDAQNLERRFFGPEPEHIEVLERASGLFYKRIKEILIKVEYIQGFRLADFSNIIDLTELHDWWVFISSSKGREFLKATGKFSSVGELHTVARDKNEYLSRENSAASNDCDNVVVVKSFALSVRVPIIVGPAKTWSLFDSEQEEILINGEEIRDKLIISIDLKKPLPSMDEFERTLRSMHGEATLNRQMLLIEQGIFPDDVREDFCAKDFLQPFIEPTWKPKLIVEQKNVSPLIFGLLCMDCICEKLSFNESCEFIVDKLRNATGKPYLTESRIRHGYYSLVAPKVNKFESKDLPWFNFS